MIPFCSRSLRIGFLLIALGFTHDGALAKETPAVPKASTRPINQTVSENENAETRFLSATRTWVAEHPILRRHYSVASLKADPNIVMKYREKPAHLAHVDDAGWERFALSLADTEASGILARSLPAVAAAYRINQDPALLAYVQEQLTELAGWAPLQRAGWSGGSDVPAAWLGTGWAVRAIVQTVAELPSDALPLALREALHARLAAEIANIREDWATKRTWFTRIEAVSSNQWVLPLEALLLASVHNGLERHRDDYEFAVAGLLRTLDAQGTRGECVEGMQYGEITFDSLLSAALAARAAGDARLLQHVWFREFPLWYLHHRQPGNFVINAFDSQSRDLNWKLVAQLVADLENPHAQWAWQRRPDLPPSSPCLATFRAEQRRDIPAAPPPAFAAYPVAARVNWLESVDAYEADRRHFVSGFWIRGGHPSDAHDHQDRGHVNFIVAGRPVLIEAGLASYGIGEHPTHFKSVAGHNVLQVGAHPPAALTNAILNAHAGQILQPEHRAAPITVHRLDASGGEVSVDASHCYASTRRWIRTARWDAATLEVRDEVELKQPDHVLFRWHLGEKADAPVIHSARHRLQVGDIQLACETDPGIDLVLSVETMPDATLTSGKLNHHATVVVSTPAAVTSLVLTTRVSLAPSTTPTASTLP